MAPPSEGLKLPLDQQVRIPDLKLTGGEGRTMWRVEAATISGDGRILWLQIPAIEPVMQFHIGLRLTARDGIPIDTFVHGTIHAWE